MTPNAEDHTLALVLPDRMPELDRESLSPAGRDRIVGRAQAEAVVPLLYRTLSRSAAIDLLPEALKNSLHTMNISMRMPRSAYSSASVRVMFSVPPADGVNQT